jgi:transposase-like protein/Zn ribbon nucleic-acid-binding protein
MKNRNEKNSITIKEFYAAFPDDEACVQHVFDSRFGQGYKCPKCNEKSNWSRITKVRAYACQWCGHHLHPTVGTLFENSRTPLQLWFYAMYLFTTSRHGVSAKELQRQLGVTYKCAFRIGHQIRQHMAEVDGELPLSGQVEIDETYIGGRTKGMGRRYTGNKTIVFGMLQRDGQVMTKVVPNVGKKTLHPIIEANVAQGSTVHTDELRSYKGLNKKGFTHKTVNHGAKEYVLNDTHVNGLENFWKHLKGSIRSTHIHVSQKNLHKYTKEFEYRFNSRENPSAMFPALVSKFSQPRS